MLVPVGDGGRAKYDPVVESEIVRVVALSNKAALQAVSVAMAYVHEHGRPGPNDLAQWTKLVDLIKVDLAATGLEGEIQDSQSQLRELGGWVWSRRQASARRRRSRGTTGAPGAVEKPPVEVDDFDFDDLDTGDQDHLDVADVDADADAKPANRKAVMPKLRTGTAVRFVGSIKDTPRQRQFDHLAAWLDDLRVRGVDEEMFPNTLCPPTAKTRDEWCEAFLNGRPDQRVRRSMAHRSKGTPEERSKVTSRAKAEKPTMATAIAAAPTSDALIAALTPDVLGLSSIIPPESGRWRANVDPRPRLV